MTNLRTPNLFGEEIPPSKDDTQKFAGDYGLKPTARLGKMATDNICGKERRD
ncbi:MAG: hypothetical protein N3B10_08445 [Armatimonadetes bacterium]|nr:hypothetical protein [Armatimonadota bacterium]MCX7968504.1 hypothetical protein [Armatimonadota bacterium]MDW8143262.1 hypothetical protein [Armatimonadota bacterium]